VNIENAVHELISMLCDIPPAVVDTDEGETDEEDAANAGRIC
jgi:hypothetical protein